MRRLHLLLPLAVAVSLVACVDEQPLDLTPSMDATATSLDVRFILRNPAGDPVCAGLPDGTTFGLLVATSGVGGYFSQDVVCPKSSAVMSLDSAVEYELLIESDVPGIAPFQLPGDTLYFTSDTSVRFRLNAGRALAGVATLNGAPWESEDLLDLAAGGRFFWDHYIGSASTDSLGRWVDRDTGLPFVLDRGVVYARRCQPGLGMRQNGGPDPDGFNYFPADFRAVSCKFVTSARERYTHRATGLQLTPEAGVIDPRWHVDASGNGFGVAWPTGGQLDFRSELVRFGALVMSNGVHSWIPRDRGELNGCPSGNALDCPYFIVTGGPNVSAAGAGRRVRWSLSDSSDASRRFDVSQTSWDGAYGDYVLFRIEVTNNSDSARTFYPAWYVEYASDVASGSTRMNGRLLAVHEGPGRWLGTYLARPFPVVARKVSDCCGIGGDENETLAVLAGDSSHTSAGPGVITTTHGTRLDIPAHRSRAFYIAFLAAGSAAALEDLAVLARNEADARRTGTF